MAFSGFKTILINIGLLLLRFRHCLGFITSQKYEYKNSYLKLSIIDGDTLTIAWHYYRTCQKPDIYGNKSGVVGMSPHESVISMEQVSEANDGDIGNPEGLRIYQ